MQRTIVLSLQRIDPAGRRTERDLWDEFERRSPSILGGLLSACAMALSRLSTLTLEATPRMADFASWVTAGEEALGLKRGSFLLAYAANQQQRHFEALEASAFGQALVSLVETEGDWIGTADDLRAVLMRRSESELGWSGAHRLTPASIGKLLRRLAPNLRGVGVSVEFMPRTRHHRLIEIRRIVSDGLVEDP